ncbi:S8 family peptidase [Bdellovibrio reynosensis]|uniref:S8 family peptidase n=1 Tax=Bdellovibrio reynosensis TaxID=2835041 RepID=A0ABY4CK81_9BACT|nr:S8 family peptidase [Bdellovibrio reynosensis]UOF02650.1 S8 family peptidase [Bdellovibrio reynosensis]
MNKLIYFFFLLFPLFASANTGLTIVTLKDLPVWKNTSIQWSHASTDLSDIQDLEILPNIGVALIRNADQATISKLHNNPYVQDVSEDHLIKIEADFKPHQTPYPLETSSVYRPGPRTPWGILATKTMKAWKRSNHGAGARVMILDSGIDYTHPYLKENFEKGQNFIEGQLPYDLTDNSGHGTHVAGTIAGSLDAHGFTGVAPRARIYAAKVCEEGCPHSAIFRALDWAVELKVDVANLSLGRLSQPWAYEAEIFRRVISSGVVVVSSAGNKNSGDFNYYPASCPGVISVAATDTYGNRSEFSNYGNHVDIAAPGSDIVSTLPLYSTESTTGFGEMSGTSMAAPHVTGVVALIKATNPSLTPEQVTQILKSTARPFVAIPDKPIGAGLANAPGAVDAAALLPR